MLPAGQVLLIEPDRSGPLWELGEPLHNPIVAKQDKDSPLMLHIRLDNVVVPEARKLTLKGPAHVLAESAAGDPLYAVLDRPGRNGERARESRCAHGRSGQERPAVADGLSDHDDQPAQLVRRHKGRAARSAADGRRRRGRAAGRECGDHRASAPRRPTAASYLFDVPEGATKVAVGPLDHAGVWSVVRRPVRDPTKKDVRTEAAATGEVVTELACNLADRRESDLRPADGLADRSTSLASGLAGLAVRPIWYYLLASAWLLSCWEWFLYQRRWID